MYLPYVYLVTNKITNEFYYGSRYRNIKLNRTPTEDFWIHYFTSSKNVKNLIDEYGKDSFEVNILLVDPEYNVCYWFEQGLIKTHFEDSLCLNNAYQDMTDGFKIFSRAGITMSDKQKSKLSKKLKGIAKGPQSETHKQNLRKPKPSGFGKQVSDYRTGKSWDYKHTDDTKELMSAWQKDIPKEKCCCIYCKNETSIMNLTKWHGVKCKLHPDFVDRIIIKKECIHCNRSIDVANYGQWHGDKCKLKST